MAKNLFNSTGQLSFVASVETELFTNCSQVSISRIVCGEAITGYKVLREGSSVTLPVGTYELSIPSLKCDSDCWVCDEPLISDATPDYEPVQMCNKATGTMWIQWHKIENNEVTILKPWEDTVISCVDYTIIETKFCKKG